VDDFGTAGALADELRRLIETLQITDVPEADLGALLADLRVWHGRVADLPRRTSWYLDDSLSPAEVFDVTAYGGREVSHVHRSPILGRLNAASPPLEIEMVTDDERPRAEGSVTFTATHEGGPGIVHGGWIAAVMDEMLGMAQPLSGIAGFTGTITVRYRSPAPTYATLHLVARVDHVEGRKIFMSGTCHAGEVLVAEAEAVCISPARS
jgi:acyl-coenzyme A thioesterase PaaI-like protein